MVGTFSILYLLGFSLNTLSLFGLVLAIGIVMMPSWWWRTSSEISKRLALLAAAHQAMREVSGPIIAIALVLWRCLCRWRFLWRDRPVLQTVAATIAISTVISAINSLTLSPALAALLLKPHSCPERFPDPDYRSSVRLDFPSV
ncbi:MAG: efflux RND transporter permease subunit [Klebsiella pneumoniae]